MGPIFLAPTALRAENQKDSGATRVQDARKDQAEYSRRLLKTRQLQSNTQLNLRCQFITGNSEQLILNWPDPKMNPLTPLSGIHGAPEKSHRPSYFCTISYVVLGTEIHHLHLITSRIQ